MEMARLARSFFERRSVNDIARELLGSTLTTVVNGVKTSGVIVETEAYRAPEDKASHAYNGRRTPRTEVMFGAPGKAYVYLCYGIHHLFNIVTAPEGVPHAVLVRAIEPVDGKNTMMLRRGLDKISRRLTGGPGVMSKALGIDLKMNDIDLHNSQIVWIEGPTESRISTDEILESPRVGVDYADEWAQLPWRYRIKDNKWTSPAK